MKYKILIAAACLLFITELSFAQSALDKDSPSLSIHPFISALGGLTFAQAGQSQSKTSGYTTLNYNANSAAVLQPFWGAFGGINFSFNKFIWQTGIMYQQQFPFTAQGASTTGINPASYSDYVYSYNIRTQQIFEGNKFSYALTPYFHPYLLVELGAAFNDTSDFKTTTDEIDVNLTPVYDNHYNTSFAYALGLGFDYAITNHWLIGLSYQLDNLGRANMGQGKLVDGSFSIPIDYSLKQNNLLIQEEVAQLTYLF